MKRLFSLSLLAALAVGVTAACNPAEEPLEITPLEEESSAVEAMDSETEMLDQTVEETDEMMYELETMELEELPEEELE